MKKFIIITWWATSELLALGTLLICSSYLLTKVVLHFQFNDLITSIVAVGVGFIVYYIHEGIFKDRRIKLKEVLHKC